MSISTRDAVTHRMAAFARGTTWEDLPEAARGESVRAWTNWVACAVGGAPTPVMDAAVRGVLALEPGGSVPVPGRRERVGLPDAAMLACVASSAYAYDDTHLATTTHPTGPVAAAVLAMAHALRAAGRPVSGTRLLTALVTGMELECRTSCAILGNGGSAGWLITGLSGGIGAAAAVGQLLGLDHDRMVSAIGLAATQACGFRATHGSMAMAWVPGLAARAGVVGARMAEAGFTCSAIAIDGRNGLLQVLANTAGPTFDTSAIDGDLGRRLEMLANTYKPYPCGIVIHPALDACLHLVHERGISHADIERIDLRVPPGTLALTWRKLPENVFEAQVSLFHWVAAAFVQRAAGVEQAALACVTDPAVRALQERTAAVADPALADNQAHVAVRLRDGRTVERFTENAIGSMTHPLTDAQIAAKFSGLVEPVLGGARAARLLEACVALPNAEDAAGVLD